MKSRIPFAIAVALVTLVIAGCFMPDVHALNKALEKKYGETEEDKALAYFIRKPRFVGSARTMFLYADDKFLGALDNDSYTLAHVDPGEHLLWMNWARINRDFEFEAGKTYYFIVVDSFLDVEEEEGLRSIEEVKYYCTAEAKEVTTSARHIREREKKAKKFAEKDTGERHGAKSAREGHIRDWPKVDLAAYPVLVLEDVKVTDPKAGKRKKQDLLKAAPTRLPNLVKSNLDKGTFEEIRRGTLDAPAEGALILRVEFTQYKPGSAAGRAMMAGMGAARLDFDARLIDGMTGAELARFSDERAYGWGGTMGSMGGIESIEMNLAYELAEYLERARPATGGETPEEPAANP